MGVALALRILVHELGKKYTDVENINKLVLVCARLYLHIGLEDEGK